MIECVNLAAFSLQPQAPPYSYHCYNITVSAVGSSKYLTGFSFTNTESFICFGRSFDSLLLFSSKIALFYGCFRNKECLDLKYEFRHPQVKTTYLASLLLKK